MIKSPFLVLKNFISPMECERLVDSIDTSFPNVNNDDVPIKTILRLPVYQNRLWARIEDFFEIIENHYGVEVDAVTPIDVEWYPENCVEEAPRCENSLSHGNKWKLCNDNDFTIIVFLKDYNNTRYFDNEFECYGGKLEITNHNFSFNPTRGTAVIFPSNQYFINRTASPKVGDAIQLRTHIVCTKRFVYDRSQYEGNYSVWFKGLT